MRDVSSESDIDNLPLAARAHELGAPRKVRWTAINSSVSPAPDRPTETPLTDVATDTTSQHCSKFRDRILDLASGLAEQKAAQPKRRKKAPATPRKKRKASIDLVVLDDGSPQRRLKAPRADGTDILIQSPLEASSKVNVLANRAQTLRETQMQQTEETISKAGENGLSTLSSRS